MRFLSVILALSIFVLAACGVVENSKQAAADDMLKAFSQGCNLGQWTQAALVRSDAIVQMYTSLMQKGSCKDHTGVLQNALHASLALQAELRAMDADSDRKRERRMDDAANDLLLTMNNLDPGIPASVKEQLASYYSSARYEQALAKADVNFVRNPSYKSRITYGMANVSSHMRSLLSASDKLAECYANNPSVAVELATSIAQLAGTFASPAVGLGVSTLSTLLQAGITYARTLPAAEAVYEANKVKMPTALQCGLEALSRDFCKGKDAALLASLVKKDEQGESLPFFQGMEILDRYMPALNGWLDRVVNGSDMSDDPNQADKINFQFQRLTTSQSMRRTALAIGADTQKRIQRSPTPEEKVKELRSGLLALVRTFFNHSYGSGMPVSPEEGPFAGESPRSFVEKAIEPKELRPGTFNTVAELVDAARIDSSDWPNVTANSERLFQTRYASILREFNEKVNVNISGLVRDATVLTHPEEVSPLEAMEEIFRFFDQYAYESGSNGKRDEIIISQLRERIHKVHAVLSDPKSVDDYPVEIPCPSGGNLEKCYDLSPAKVALATTFDTFKLDKNNVFIPGAMSKLVSTDLGTRYRRGEGPKEIDQLFRLAGADLGLLFNRAGLTPVAVLHDVSAARSISQANLQQFREKFMGAIGLAMRDLKKAAEDSKEPPAGDKDAPNRTMLSKLCLLTLVTGMEWPTDLDKSICMGTKLVSQEAQLELKFEDVEQKLSGKAFYGRVCAYEEFLRFDRLANLNLKDPPRNGSIEVLERVERPFWQKYLDLKLGAGVSIEGKMPFSRR